MLDLRLIREDPEGVRSALARRGEGVAEALDAVIELDRRRRELLPELEGLRAEQNRANERIRGATEDAEREREIAAMREVSSRAKQLDGELAEVQERLTSALAPLPNLPDPTAAPGHDDELVLDSGPVPELAFAPRDHLELAGEMIDTERGARLSGSRFAYLRGPLVMLELALVRWALEKLSGRGFEPVIPPVLVRERALYGTGFLPDTEQQIYTLPEDELFLLGTSEVALASLHDEEILDAERLPLRYAGFSPCFRREAGAAGRDTRGIFRVHQFDKVEMFSFVAPEESQQEHERIREIEQEILGELGLPFRVVNIAVTDLGSSAAEEVRLRGVAAEPGPLPRADLVLEHDRLPGPAPEHPHAGGQAHAGAAHAQRHRRRGRAHDSRAAGERPARGRERHPALGSDAVRRASRAGARRRVLARAAPNGRGTRSSAPYPTPARSSAGRAPARGEAGPSGAWRCARPRPRSCAGAPASPSACGRASARAARA